MKIQLASELQSDSIVDGEGMRIVVWTQGCMHNCLGCHNPETHSFTGGTWKNVDDLKEEILKFEAQDGITLSGGDPFYQPEASAELAKWCKDNELNVWCYTGFTFEQLKVRAKVDYNVKELLENIDVLVDGKFDMSKKSLNLYFRGSTNQRILDIKESLKQNKAVEIEKYKEIKVYEEYSRERVGMFI